MTRLVPLALSMVIATGGVLLAAREYGHNRLLWLTLSRTRAPRGWATMLVAALLWPVALLAGLGRERPATVVTALAVTALVPTAVQALCRYRQGRRRVDS